jgi:homoserine kinase type II
MAFLTPFPHIDALRVASEFGIELARVEPLAAGSVNSNFRWVGTDGRQWFARIYEEQGRDGARAELTLLQELARAGAPAVVPVLRPDGAALAEYLGKPVAAFPWIQGDILCQARVTPDHCRAVGRALAQVHLASPKVGRLGVGRFGPDQLSRRLDDIEARAPAELVNAARSVRGKLAEVTARRAHDLPSGVIHGDLFRDNVLWHKDEIGALLDFESASHGPFAYDLSVTALAWCYSNRFDAALLSALLDGYHAERPLAPAERAALATEGALGCLRFATTRITDFSMRAPPGKPPLRDYRRMLARLEGFERGVLDAAIAGLTE